MNIKSLLQNKVFVESEVTKLQQFQDRALQICNDFDIQNVKMIITKKNGKVGTYTKNYRAIIFGQAKKNMSYLEAKVALCEEKFGKNGCKGKGNYLISLFRKTKPWDNK